MLSHKVRNYSYEEFHFDIHTLAKDIKNSGFIPDVIVGIARGGLIPAVYLSHELNIPLVTAAWSLRDGMTLKNIPYEEILSYGKNVLLVDDMIDSGNTLIDILNNFREQPWNFNIEEAVLWQNTDCDVWATFYANEIKRSEDDSWIIYPWEVHSEQ